MISSKSFFERTPKSVPSAAIRVAVLFFYVVNAISPKTLPTPCEDEY